MDLLSRSTILYINQVRQENFKVLIGKGFSEAFSWRKYFKKILFICYSKTDDILYKKIFNNCYLIGIPFDLSKSPFKSILNIGKNYLKLYIYLRRLIRITKIDIVRMENLLLSGLPTYFLCKTKKIPYIVWLGGHEKKALYLKYKRSFFTWLLAKLIILFEKIILKNASFVFPVTEELMDLVKKRNIKNRFLSPNYINLSKFKNLRSNSRSNDKIKILYVGRFEQEKGIKVLLNAIKLLQSELNNYDLFMVGGGSLEEWIKKYITKNQLKNVKLCGRFNHEDMPAIYNSADIFILPSHTEGSPASLIEAMSCGTASIATSVGECKNIIKNGENGFLIPPNNSKIMSETLKILIENKNLRSQFSENGRISIEKYTKNYKKIHKYVYQQILKLFNK